MRYILLSFAILWALVSTPAQASAAPRVVATLKPIHALAASLMAGIGDVDLLMSSNQSPHGYSPRPSDLRELRRARIVFWIGPTMEASLARFIAGIAGETRIVSVLDMADLERLPAREGGVWQTAEHAGDDGRIDPHIWLSPDNARRIAAHMRDALIDVDPGHAGQYRANLLALDRDIQALDRRLADRLAPVADKPYIVFHDAYQYFERHYGLRAAGSVTIGPDRAPGARRVHALRELMQTSGARCVFGEPQFPPKLVNTLLAGSDARFGVLDPLGAGLDPGPAAYAQLLRDLTDSLVACLSG